MKCTYYYILYYIRTAQKFITSVNVKVSNRKKKMFTVYNQGYNPSIQVFKV